MVLKGGKREGAGRKNYGKTKVYRLPVAIEEPVFHILEEYKDFIDRTREKSFVLLDEKLTRLFSNYLQKIEYSSKEAEEIVSHPSKAFNTFWSIKTCYLYPEVKRFLSLEACHDIQPVWEFYTNEKLPPLPSLETDNHPAVSVLDEIGFDADDLDDDEPFEGFDDFCDFSDEEVMLIREFSVLDGICENMSVAERSMPDAWGATAMFKLMNWNPVLENLELSKFRPVLYRFLEYDKQVAAGKHKKMSRTDSA